MAGRFATLGNDLYAGNRSFNIVGERKKFFLGAGALLLIALALLFARGLNTGIEFRGGSEFVVPGAATTSSEPAQAALDEVAPGQIARVAIVGGSSVRVQTELLEGDNQAAMTTALGEAYEVDPADITASFVGPAWGADVTGKAIQGLVVFIVLVTIVMAIYFRTWSMALAALIALINDLIVTVGLYAGIGFEVTPATVIGILTILGYSLYDTVVVFDKVRENTEHVLDQSRVTYAEASNLAVNQTIIRSINTSIVGVLPVAAILFVGAFLLGAGTLRDIALALFIGMIVSTASSIFLAAPLEVVLRLRRPKYAEHTAKVLAARAASSTSDVTVTNADTVPVLERVTATTAGGHLGQAAQPRRKKR